MSNEDLILVEDEINEQPSETGTIISEDDPADQATEDQSDKFKGRVTKDGENIIVKLTYPKEYRARKNGVEEKRTLSEVTFRPMNGSDIQNTASFRDENERGIRVLIRISNITEALFQIMDARDIRFCSEAIEHFLSDGP
ncbi:hypothetical protein [Micavibrio aeruginosavorus]|uniref:hypothetical protein n=1 Tax=Micavibrio aeruginosavorus TaxID=349221 RepID=UPI003F4AB4AF